MAPTGRTRRVGEEVYVAPFPGPGGTQAASLPGGRAERWLDDGRELFYLSLRDELMAVEVRPSAGGLLFGEGRKLFRTRPKWLEDPPIVFVQNWTAELAK